MPDDDRGVEELLRSDLDSWKPRRGPDLADLMSRAERQEPWRAPVAMVSSVVATAIGVLFLASLVLVVLAPQIPGGEVLRTHLLMAP